MLTETDLRRSTFRLAMPQQYDDREVAMIEELCSSLAIEVSRLTGLRFRLYFEEYDMTHKKVSWQARLTTLPEIAPPILAKAAQITYEALNHNDSTENYHGCFSMMIQSEAVPADEATAAKGKKFMINSQVDSILRLAESQYRTAIDNHYHEWGTHYKNALVFTEDPEVFMHDLQAFPEFREQKCACETPQES